jgi:Domain of unknown function (DUF4340)
VVEAEVRHLQTNCSPEENNMKIRSLIVAALALLLLMAALYWSDHRKPADGIAKASADLAPPILKLDEGTIAKLELKRKGAEPIVLTKNNSGAWQIVEPKRLNADQNAVSSAVSTLSALNSERLVEDKASDLKPFGLDHPSIEVDLSEKDNKSQTLFIGDPTPAGSAFYAKLGNDARVFTLPGYTKTSIDKNLNDLRDKRLLTMDADKISRLELDRKNQIIEFGRDKDEWQILKPKPSRADSLQVNELVGKLADARMDLSGSDEDSKDAASAFAKAMPLATVKLTDQSGTQELQLRKNKDTYYAKSSTVEGVYKVGFDLGQALDKGLADFRNKKLFDFGFSDPRKIEMHSGSTAYFLIRNGSDWWSNGTKMDASAVESYISDLRDLAASKFVESGFANPSIEIAVTWDDGKHVEKVSVAKSANAYVAKRENDPTFYEIDSPAIDGLEKAAADIKPASPSAK